MYASLADGKRVLRRQRSRRVEIRGISKRVNRKTGGFDGEQIIRKNFVNKALAQIPIPKHSLKKMPVADE